jgi:hypothetical protein
MRFVDKCPISTGEGLTVSATGENGLAYYKILLCTDSPRFTFILYIQYEEANNQSKPGYLLP